LFIGMLLAFIAVVMVIAATRDITGPLAIGVSWPSSSCRS
jgi:hypothetical protein